MAVLAWFAVIMQFQLMLTNELSIIETTIRFFSFFTILSNVLVAISSTVITFSQERSTKSFFERVSVISAITVYILVVAFVYNIMLRFLWNPEGLQRIVDELLHAVIPLFYFIYWLIFVSKKTLSWGSFFPWLIFPLFYCIYILVRGNLSNYYPYPFMDVSQLGIEQVLLNSLGVTVIFLFFSLLLICFAKILTKPRLR